MRCRGGPRGSDRSEAPERARGRSAGGAGRAAGAGARDREATRERGLRGAGGLGKRIGGKQRQDVGTGFEEGVLGAGDDGIGAAVAERGEPQIPIETGLIGGVDAGSFVWILGLKPKFVGQPILAVIGALEFDFVAAAGHYREEAVAVGDAKRL